MKIFKTNSDRPKSNSLNEPASVSMQSVMNFLAEMEKNSKIDKERIRNLEAKLKNDEEEKAKLKSDLEAMEDEKKLYKGYGFRARDVLALVLCYIIYVHCTICHGLLGPGRINSEVFEEPYSRQVYGIWKGKSTSQTKNGRCE